MRVGYDAKRAFFNWSGLGNYSRNLIRLMQKHYPENRYLLFSPPPRKFPEGFGKENTILIEPGKSIHRLFPSLWRSSGITADLKRNDVDLYHGLSNELPYGIHRSGIPCLVTIHDLIFMRYPHWYPLADRMIYKNKFRYSSHHAKRIISVSRQTKSDLIDFFHVHEEKVDVVYQGCNPAFYVEASQDSIVRMLEKYKLPKDFILYVGTIEPRKNLLGLLKAMSKGIDVPLVAVGRKTSYFRLVSKYIRENRIRNVFFINTLSNEELPVLYQAASLFVYPSVFEGFGIPILEALASRTPVITSRNGCFREAGGDNSMYVDPSDTDELSFSIRKILEDPTLKEKMIKKGYDHALNFTGDRVAQNVHRVYRKILQTC